MRCLWLIPPLLWLTACAAPPPVDLAPTQASDGAALSIPTLTPTYGLAGQSVSIQYTALAVQQTQAALQVRVAEATSQMQQTQDARNAQSTDVAATSAARADEFNFQQTVSAATQSARETQLAFDITAGVATQAARSTQAAAVYTATATANTAARDEENSNVWRWFWGIVISLATAIALWYLAQIGRGLARRADPGHDPTRVRILRIATGTLVITPLAGGGFQRELLALPQLSSDHLAEERFDTDEEIPSGADEVPIFSRGNLTSLYRRDEGRAQYEQDEATRKFMLWFLRKCIAVAGRESNIIPPHDKLGVATETWGKATNLLASSIEKRRGRNGGTWLVGEYATLMELWLAVGERRYVPRPSSRRVVVDGTAHSPAPIESLAMK